MAKAIPRRAPAAEPTDEDGSLRAAAVFLECADVYLRELEDQQELYPDRPPEPDAEWYLSKSREMLESIRLRLERARGARMAA